MSRAATGDTVVLKPSANVYTGLAAIAFVATLIAVIVLYMRAKTLIGELPLL